MSAVAKFKAKAMPFGNSWGCYLVVPHALSCPCALMTTGKGEPKRGEAPPPSPRALADDHFFKKFLPIATVRKK